MQNISILTTSDFPYGGAPENFVREMVKGINSINRDIGLEIIRFWGDRYNYYNDTNIQCTNYLFKKPFNNKYLKFFELIFQIFYSPLFLIKIRFYNKSKYLLLYGVDRAYIVFPLLLFSKILGIKCYRVITEIYQAKDYASIWWRKPLLFFNTIQIKCFDRFLDGLIVLSSYLKKLCINNRVKESNICLIPHFISFENNIKYTELNIERDTFKIVYSGSITYENGVLDLIEAFLYLKKNNKITDASLTILGGKNYSLVPLDREMFLEEFDVKFTGNLQIEEVFGYLRSASLLVNPRREGVLADSGFPTKIGEYFSTKVPVLSTKVGDLALYFHDGVELYFSLANNPELLSDKINYIYENEKKSIQVGMNGYNWGKINLDNVSNARKLLNFMKIDNYK